MPAEGFWLDALPAFRSWFAEPDYDSPQTFKENVLKVHFVSKIGLLKVEKRR
ncbi:hypothetical protein AMC82_PC00013 (plasmid) [Rhizobium phaseoli]|nr:hypothetical protein AMC84_PC00013 [Rhizobium phaseoli]ANL81386.1 hypothetical protein AMC82_PC00013 [Rhizobium phaseoli]